MLDVLTAKDEQERLGNDAIANLAKRGAQKAIIATTRKITTALYYMIRERVPYQEVGLITTGKQETGTRPNP